MKKQDKMKKKKRQKIGYKMGKNIKKDKYR